MGDSNDKPDEQGPWQQIGSGLFMALCTVGVFYLLWNMEITGGSMRTHVLIVLLYNIGGKWTVAVLGGLGSVCLVGLGISGLLSGEGQSVPKKRKKKRKPDAAKTKRRQVQLEE